MRRNAKKSDLEYQFRSQQSNAHENERREVDGPELSRKNLQRELSENSANPAGSHSVVRDTSEGDQSTAEVNLIYSTTHEEDISEPLIDYEEKRNPLHQRSGVTSNSRLEVLRKSKEKTEESMALL
ncbi:hypothetical protein COOONC_12356 [Cooperia oncophora]